MFMRSGSWLSLVFLCAIVCSAPACKKTSGDSGDVQPAVVALMGRDLNPDGSVSNEGMKKLESQASAQSITLRIVRAQISDAGLNQLGKFRNIRGVDAYGSPLTDTGIQMFKKSVPEAEVNK